MRALLSARLWTIFTLIAALPAGAEPTELRDLLREGLYKEEVSRTPTEAIRIYEDLLKRHDEERAIAASALYRLACLHLEAGEKERAVADYKLLATRFPEAKKEIEMMTAKLTAEGILPAAESASATRIIVNVVGEVKRPGPVEIETSRPISIIEAVARAGGFSDTANAKKASLWRNGKTQLIDLSKPESQALWVQEGDIVTIPQRIF